MVKVLIRKVSQKSCQRNGQVTGGGLGCCVVDTDDEGKEIGLLKKQKKGPFQTIVLKRLLFYKALSIDVS